MQVVFWSGIPAGPSIGQNCDNFVDPLISLPYLVATATPSPLPLQCGSTPLHYAAYYGHLESVRLLLARGADMEGKDLVRGGGKIDSGDVWRHIELW